MSGKRLLWSISESATWSFEMSICDLSSGVSHMSGTLISEHLSIHLNNC